jgi:hypothetical protein
MGHAHGDPGEVVPWELPNWGKAVGSTAQIAHALVRTGDPVHLEQFIV